MNGRIRLPEVVGVLALVLLVSGFLFPLVLLQAPSLYSDGAIESMPRAMGIARIVQDGGIPMWDSSTFAGARPFYVTNQSAVYYPLMYPFFLAADLEDLNQATMWLMLIPYALHLLWAGLGMYAFTRREVGLHFAGAFTAGLLYALSPEMGVQIFTPDGAFLFSYLPWIVFAAARFIRTGSVAWWLAGVVFLGLMCSVGTMNFVIRVYFVCSVICGLLWLSWLRDWGAEGKTWQHPMSIGRLAGVAAMFLLSIGLNGFAGAGVLQGVAWITDAAPLTCDGASTMSLESSMPPSFLATLFVPGLFGVLGAEHGWGIAIRDGVTNVSALTGGLLAMAAAVTAVLGLRDEGVAFIARRWTAIALVLLVASLATMMGRYTPFFNGICTVLPWFFQAPHPIYYRFVECWSVALLVGIGISWLFSNPGSRGRFAAAASLCVGAMLVLTACAALISVPVGPSTVVRAFETIRLYGEWEWFVSGPLTYAGVAVVFLAATVLAPRHRGSLLVGGLVLESLFVAYPVFYESLLFEQTRPAPSYDLVVPESRHQTIASHADYIVTERLADLIDGDDVRFVGYNSTVDNHAWSHDLRALFGYSSKPLQPDFASAIASFTRGAPYDLKLGNLDTPSLRYSDIAAGPFLGNMNVGFLIDVAAGPPDLERVVDTEKWSVYRLPEPLPWAFTQRTVIAADRETQKQLLRSRSLHDAVYVDFDAPVPAQAEIRELPPQLALSFEERRLSLADFHQRQKADAVLRVDRGRPNHVSIEVAAAEPTMLVLAETWHEGWNATVDGNEVPVLRVNYLQQGIWLEEGGHLIEMHFFPTRARVGAAISLLSILVLLGVGLAAARGRLVR